MYHVIATNEDYSTIRSNFSRLVRVGVQLTVYMLAPLLLAVFLNKYIGYLDTSFYANFSLLSKLNLTLMITVAAFLQALYFFGGQAKAKNNPEMYHSFMLTGIVIAVILGLAMTIFSINGASILTALNISAIDHTLARNLGICFSVSMIPYSIVMVLGIHLSINNRSGQMACFHLAGSLSGIGLATYVNSLLLHSETKLYLIVLTTGFSYLLVLALVFALLVYKNDLKISLASRARKEHVSNAIAIAAVGLPIALVVLIENLAFLFSALLVAREFSEYIALHAIGLLLFSIFEIFAIGLSQAASQFIALHSNEASTAIRKAIYHTALAITVIFSLSVFTAFYFFGMSILQFFLPANYLARLDETILSQICLLVSALVVMQTFILIGVSVLRGLGDTKSIVIPGILGYIVLNIGSQWFFASYLDLKVSGVWIGMLVGFAVSAIYIVSLAFYMLRTFIAEPSQTDEDQSKQTFTAT